MKKGAENMAEINRFAVIGGDLRQAYLAQSIAQDGYFVYAAALDDYSFSTIVRKTDLRRAVEQCTHDTGQVTIAPISKSVPNCLSVILKQI